MKQLELVVKADLKQGQLSLYIHCIIHVIQYNTLSWLPCLYVAQWSVSTLKVSLYLVTHWLASLLPCVAIFLRVVVHLKSTMNHWLWLLYLEIQQKGLLSRPFGAVYRAL